jgi:hypothetical protein
MISPLIHPKKIAANKRISFFCDTGAASYPTITKSTATPLQKLKDSNTCAYVGSGTTTPEEQNSSSEVNGCVAGQKISSPFGKS